MPVVWSNGSWAYPGLLTDVAVTAAVAAGTFVCGGGILCTVAITTTYTVLTEPDQPQKLKPS